ncbi:hypothetical protein EYF80_047174 [Liparis tanakae]|uniref:Secreted protein n=1 Tax=Liparis tanakae TaxID=230148 RepID=A0A4Z2FNA7_9TELE|nr:hypothetical protein EYF80_047174 [Liparis tanakae]
MKQDSSGVDRVLVLFVFWCSTCCPSDYESTPVLMRYHQLQAAAAKAQGPPGDGKGINMEHIH